ncbi:hypothetical protein IJT17_05175 [bacterium]|nr:hypothetical protein [bacterium]
MLDKLSSLDRRWIFLAITIAVIIPFVFPLGLPIKVSQQTKQFYECIEQLPQGSVVCMSFDYGPGTRVECHPMAQAALYHLFTRRCKVIALALWPEGALFAREALREAAKETGAAEGTDYVNLGYKAGGEVVLRGAGDDLRAFFPNDIDGRSWDSIPMLKGIKGWDTIDLICAWSMGKPGVLEYVRVVGGSYHRPIITGTTAVTAPEAMPLVNSGQIEGILQGMRGASEYEVMLKRPGAAARGMDALSMAHVAIAAFIIMANVIYWLNKRRDRRNSLVGGGA